MNSIYRILILLLMVSISSCVSSQSGTSASSDEDKDVGLGGTGMLANVNGRPGGGLGGTGIVGEITGFGSIFVNGIEVEYDDNISITVNGEENNSHQLEIGDVVEILTTDDNKFTHALSINVRHEVVGKVDSVSAENFSFKVHGQTVIHAINKGKLPEIGATVAVSGFRVDEQTILSTRVVPVETGKALLRSYTELPYRKRATRWLVQAYVQGSSISFHLDGNSYTLAVRGKVKESLNGRTGISILELYKTSTGDLKINQVIKAAGIARGRRIQESIQTPGGSMIQKPMNGIMSPASTPANGHPDMNRRNR